MIHGVLASRYGITGVLGSARQRAAGGGWWDDNGAISGCVAAYQAVGVADYATSKVNLANPGTYNITEGKAPAWDTDNGWKFDGSTNSYYLKTGVIPSSLTWTAIIRYSDFVSELAYAAIYYAQTTGPTKGFGIQKTNFRFANGGRVAVAGLDTFPSSAVFAVANRSIYRDGALLASNIPEDDGVPNTDVYLGVANQNGGPDGATYIKAYIKAVSFYDNELTLAQIATETTAMNAL